MEWIRVVFETNPIYQIIKLLIWLDKKAGGEIYNPESLKHLPPHPPE